MYREDIMEKNGELYVPPVPGRGFISDYPQIPWDSEILQSFADLTKITNFTFQSFDIYEDSLEEFTYQLVVGSYDCDSYYHQQCVPPYKYYPWYIWTKEGFKIQINYSDLKTLNFKYIHILNPTPSFHHKDPG